LAAILNKPVIIFPGSLLPRVSPPLHPGNKYVLNEERDYITMKQLIYFSQRVLNLWNNLPADVTDFMSLRKCNNSINKK